MDPISNPILDVATCAAVRIKLKINPDTEDRLRAKIIEALFFLENNAPSRAHEVLTEALAIRS